MRDTSDRPTLRHRERGAALLVGLLLLLILSLLGVTAMQSAAMQERLAGNTRDLNTAFQAAEGALRNAERRLQGASLDTGSPGWYSWDANPAPTWRDDAHWSSFTTIDLPDVAETWGLATAPRYALEQLPPEPAVGGSLEAGAALPDLEVFRVTARATGGSTGTVVVLQSTYRR